MTLANVLFVFAVVILAVACVARGSKPLQLLALCANALFLWAGFMIGSWGLLGVNLLLTVLSLRALVGKTRGRRPTRPAAQMDVDVHDRIREISAKSRYSSAGIEF